MAEDRMAMEPLDFPEDNGPPGEREIDEANSSMLRRQRDFRKAAEYVAAAFAAIPGVGKIVLFGATAAPLRKEVPRFREFRRAGAEIYHELKDVDLAVWVADQDFLGSLQKARSRALNDLLRERNVGVAHHQIDVFLMEPETGRYLGRLCCFNTCPKGKDECRVLGCGVVPFLRRHEKFVFNPESLEPARVVLLYERGGRSVCGSATGEHHS